MLMGYLSSDCFVLITICKICEGIFTNYKNEYVLFSFQLGMTIRKNPMTSNCETCHNIL